MTDWRDVIEDKHSEKIEKFHVKPIFIFSYGLFFGDDPVAIIKSLNGIGLKLIARILNKFTITYE